MNFGCSSFSWKTKDGRHLLGRTYDQLGNLRANRVICVPKGSPCLPGLQPAGREVTAHYGYTGMAVLGYGEPILVDGVNEAGLMGALLHYPEYAIYPPKPRPDQMAVHPGRLLAYLFGLCSGVEEVAALLPTVALVDDLSLGSPLPAHYIFSDRSGEAAVLEPDTGGLKLHRHTIGVLTNSPDYLWHRTNLRTYVGTTNLPKPPHSIAGHEIRAFGERLGGGFGLPGDYTSPSRFVRMAFMKEFAVEGIDELDGVSRMFRAFSPVNIPEGLSRTSPDAEEYQQTLCISVMCAESGIYYFSPAQNRRISAVRLPRGTGAIRQFPLGEHQDVNYRN
ncbi:linear amide C-N hydrolase [Muriventricola aceti]|uniref:linear amide C-N hydrolase n=1 Tax=Muriventricola aceti TaxID=2981773 RepID=UPI00082317E0|nr:linear amide C-N hydrolase [Muriventricola aceti]MCU6701754.1 linear amide C-N hydrolase [Muriventricola aceti]SCI74570.1 Penicillin acylase precursor [uncultured Flavonifractor sp.]